MSLDELRRKIDSKSVEKQLTILSETFPGKVVFTTSFGIEDQVITHYIFNNNIPIDVVTIDTGRLFPETYKVLNGTIIKYKKRIAVYFPEHASVEKMMTEKGSYSFYYSKENRLECCRLRKVNPLNRALEGKKIWVSGIRASQSENRSQMDWLEFDEGKMLYKFYPLFNWSFDEVRNFVRINQIPYNALHDKGFVSIGCEPCTRAVNPGDDFRAGRWWWEADGKKECGFHIKE